jgi:hypothetical protein
VEKHEMFAFRPPPLQVKWSVPKWLSVLSGTININGLIEEKKTNVVHFLVG